MIVLSNLLLLLAGLGVFLMGMQMISSNLQKMAGQNVSKMIAKISDNKLAGIGIGAGAAVLLESSSATTVILLGFVNAGIVNLIQATLIIMGANVGTTLSVVVFSLNYLPVGEFLAFLSLIGVSMVMGSKKEKTKMLGWVIAGFGLIFIGLNTMSNSVDFLKESERFVNFIASLKNPFVLVIVGTLFSAVTQSSSATTGIVITLAHAKIMPITAAFYIILGSNVGTCMSAILASFNTNLNAKRTALIQLLFNVFGVVMFMPFLIIWGDKLTATLQESFSPSVIIAYFHVFFNLITTIILLPFVKHIVKLAVTIIPDKMSKEKIEKIQKRKIVSKNN